MIVQRVEEPHRHLTVGSVDGEPQDRKLQRGIFTLHLLLRRLLLLPLGIELGRCALIQLKLALLLTHLADFDAQIVFAGRFGSRHRIAPRPFIERPLLLPGHDGVRKLLALEVHVVDTGVLAQSELGSGTRVRHVRLTGVLLQPRHLNVGGAHRGAFRSGDLRRLERRFALIRLDLERVVSKSSECHDMPPLSYSNLLSSPSSSSPRKELACVE